MSLYLVSTPIGNLKDISQRALETLKKVDEIICESTDKALKILNYYQISKPLTHLSEENQLTVIPKIIEKLKNNKDFALIADAGTPTISDPGQLLVKLAIKNNIKIIPIPGPSAILCSLIASGLPTQPFLFLGFLPKKSSEKEKIFENIKEIKINNKSVTIIFFESPKRIIDTLKMIGNILGENTQLSIGREITKIYEEFIRGNVNQTLRYLESKPKIKGEITVVLKSI